MNGNSTINSYSIKALVVIIILVLALYLVVYFALKDKASKQQAIIDSATVVSEQTGALQTNNHMETEKGDGVRETQCS